MDFQFNLGASPRPGRGSKDEPSGVLILADFSGRKNRGVCEPLARRRVAKVDADNLDEVFASWGAALTLPTEGLPGGSLKVAIASLQAFHPDHLLQHLPPLSDLFAARSLLQVPGTAEQGARELERLLGVGGRLQTPNSPPAGSMESTDETLARLLGSAPQAPTAARPGKPASGFDLQALIKGIVGTANATPAAPPGAPGLVAAAELELATRLRTILRQPDFQALEVAWRGMDFLIRRLPDEDRMQVYLADVTREEMAADLAGAQRLLGRQPWSLILGHDTFGETPADLAVLAAIARLCAARNAVFLATAHPRLVGCDSFGVHPDPDDWSCPAPTEVREAWQAFRSTSEAAYVGLALPRFLLRQPYGKGSDSIDSFPFEEVPNPAAHKTFLWGSPAFLCALAMLDPSAAGGDIGELPVFRFTEDGESMMKPCAEAWLTDRAAQAILDAGLIPVLSIKDSDAVRVVGLQSCRHPATRLEGK